MTKGLGVSLTRSFSIVCKAAAEKQSKDDDTAGNLPICCRSRLFPLLFDFKVISPQHMSVQGDRSMAQIN